MRITSKGQVTIPIAIREKAGLMPNTEVDFDFDGQYVRIRRARRRGDQVSDCKACRQQAGANRVVHESRLRSRAV